MVADDWKEQTLESLSKSFTKQTGFDYTAYIKPSLIKIYKNGYIPFIQNKDFEGLWINYDTDYYIPEKIALDFPRILLDEKCLLVSISGKVGNLGVFSNVKKAFIGGAVAVIKFKDLNTLEWVMYYLFSDIGQKKLLKNVKAGSHKNLILDDIRKTIIPMPPKPEQKAIATALSDTDALIDALEKLIAKKEAIKTGTMQQLLTGKKRLDGFSGEWVEKRLGDIGEVLMCKRIFSYQTKKSGSIPFYKIGTFGKKADAFITKELYNDFRKKFSFPKVGDILISASGTIGRTIVYNGKPSYFQDSNIVWIGNDEKMITNDFLYYVLQVVKYESEGSTIQRLYNSIIKNTNFMLPATKEEQTIIATTLSNIDKEIETLKSKLSKLKAIKEGMMQELLSGKTRLLREVS